MKSLFLDITVKSFVKAKVHECIVLYYYFEEYFLVFFYYCNRHVRQHPHQITQISVKKHIFFRYKKVNTDNTISAFTKHSK